MTNKKYLTWLAAAFGVLIAAGAIWLYVVEALAYPSLSHFHGPVIGGDFRSFWAPARLIWLHEAYGAYNEDIITPMMGTFMDMKWYMRVEPLYYPPSYLLFLAPFGLLEYFPSLIAFFCTTLGLYLITLWVITRRWWFVVFMLCFTGIWINLVTGQNGLLTSSLFGLGFALLPVNPAAAGIFFGLLTFKPHLGVLIPIALLATRQWRAIRAAALTFAVMVALTLVLFGSDIWTWGLKGMFTASFNLAQDQRLWGRIPSVFAMMRVFGFSPGLAMLIHLGMACLVMGMVWMIWRRSKNYNLNAAATASAALLVAPFMYDYDMMLMGISIAFLLPEIARTRWWWGEQVVLPLVIVWPTAVGWISRFSDLQLGIICPILMVFIALRRLVKERKVAAAPLPALNT